MVTSTSKEKNTTSIRDRVVWWVVFAIVAAGIWGNSYYREDLAVYIRALALIGLAVLAGFLLFQTERGRNLWILIRDARSELRRVIWPNRQETLQTTLIVLVMVMIFALILWMLDSGLSFLTTLLLN
ncbi:MAG: preprotein translocase subunit SecE [Gammaproteobacteria bacterium]|nr:preprotein translocase subunit SecE [Gammaproteobacteria bacterium]MDE0252398.1 preprotein translocase subunit SecE [Gammaproteobacteria bacterium]MDE0402493.1 preprotein translocase subunit SecE [Gammaproteobacteria bacterium]MDE0645873.1 preprotein translocase subunit SecE [Gammaproteobacteria bacterium]